MKIININMQNVSQKMSVNVGITSAQPDFQTALSCPNKIVSSTTQSRQPPEHTFIIGPVYSLAGGSELQGTNSSQSGNCSEQAPAISCGQTMCSGYGTQQTNVSAIQLSEKPQICIGSVFTLADNPVTQDCTNSLVTSQEREHPPSHKVKNITIQSVQSLSQMSPPPNTSYFISTQSSNSTTATFKLSSPVIAKQTPLTQIWNQPLLFHLPLSSVNTGRSYILSTTSNPERVLHKPSEPCSGNIPLNNINIYGSPTVTYAVPALVTSSSLKTTSNTQPISSHKHTNPIKGNAEIRYNEMSKTDDAHREIISIDNKNSTSNMQPHAVSISEVVDLDTEDIDDCLLVKVDLNRTCYPFGNKINNIEVVIDDSDTDEDITDVTDKNEDKRLKVQSLACETASDSVVSNKCRNDNSTVNKEENSDSSTVSVNVNNTVDDILNMEVEEINNETDSLFTQNCEQSILISNVCSGDETLNTAVNTDPKVAVTSNSETDIHIASNVQNSEISSSSWHIVGASATCGDDDDDDSAGEFELLELHVDDETPPAENFGSSSLKLITPSEFSQTKNISTINIPEPVHMSFPPSNSLLNKNTVASVLQTGGQIPYFEGALQDQGNTNVLSNKEVSTLHPQGSITQYPVMNGSTESIISTSKKQSKKVANKPKQATRNKTIAETSNNQQFSDQIQITQPNKISISTKFAQKPPAMCKICFLPFYSRIELVTHTWNCHRKLQSLSYKCERCEKTFKHKSALQLHQKIICFSISGKESHPKQVNGGIESILVNLLTGNSTSTSKADTFVTISSADHPNQKSKSRMVVTKEAVVDLAVSDHKQLKKTGGACSNVVNLLRSESCEASACEYLLPDKQSLTAKSPMNVAQSECQMTMIKSEINNFHDPVTTGIVSSTDTPSSSGLDQHQQESGHEILNKAIHECSNCLTKFVNQLQLQEHQLNSDCFKTSKSYICFVCKEKFAESPLRYMHMWTNPQCKEGINKYCFMCSKIFKDASKKQAHFKLSRACCLYEMQLTIDYVRSFDENITENIDKSAVKIEEDCQLSHSDKSGEEIVEACQLSHSDKNRVEIEEDCQASTTCDITDPPSSKTNADLTQPSCEISLVVDKVQNPIHCKLYTNEFHNDASLREHLQMSPACKSYTDTLCKQQENNKSAAQNLETEEMSNIKCPACKKQFATNSILTHHLMGSTKCRMKALQRFKVDKKHPLIGKKKKICVQPKDCTVQQFELKESNVSNCKSLTISLEPSSVMCKNCHSPFTGDLKLAEHIRLSYSCRKMYPERTNKNVELKKLLLSNVTGTKDGKKNWSCLIASGISDTTSIISMNSTNEDQIPWTEQTAEVDGNLQVIPLSDSTDVPSVETPDNQVLNISSAKQVCVRDEVCISDREKDLMQSLLSSDSESDTEETEDSISDSDACEYKCRHCSETFTCRSAYIKHTKLHHSSSQNRSIHCKVCTRKFQDLTGLQAHLLQFRFCFIPLTRTLWERTQDPQSCSMCKKILHSPKDLRKHCFKKMACRLRYINAVLQNQKGKDTFNRSVFTETPKTPLLPPNEIKISVSKTKENCSESKKGANKVSLVRDNECPQDYDIPLINVGHDNGCTDTTKDAPSPSSKCLHCGKTYNNITEHLFNHQACLNFYGRHTNEHPVQLPFCYKCKQIFDNIVTPTNHICKSKVTYTHSCQKCGLKFNNEKDFNVHIYHNTACKAAAGFVQVKKHRKTTDLLDKNGGQLILSAVTVAASSTTASKDITSVEQQFPCMICNAKFPTLRLLMEHSSHHVEETPIKCDRCNMTFVHYNRFVSHQAFHMRMDKEVSICPEQVQNNVLPSVVKKSESSNSNDADITKTHDKQGAKNILVCLFCHQEFPTRAAKCTHLSNSPSCRGAMTYILDNRFFVKDSESQESCAERVADTNSCDFCHQKISNQISHYLQSACLYKLEDAIFRFRSSISSMGNEKATSILPDSNSKTTICDDFLVPTLQNISCPICKQSFDNHNLLANHHRENHAYADVEKLPPQDYMNDKFDKQEAIYCFKCKNILRTLMDVRKHSFTCTHRLFLPHSIVENAEWDPQNYMCKICDLKFANKHSLFRHMITKHCNDTNMLLAAAGHSASLCSICNQQILVQKERAHFQQHREAFVKAMKENSILDITAHSDGVCIFCGCVYSSVKLLCSHVNMHTYSDIFIKRNYVLKQKKSNQNLQLNDIKQQTLESGIHNSSDLGLVAVGSKIDDKKVSCEQPFKLSLETSHLQFSSKKCKAYTKPIKHRPDIDTGECSSSTPLTFTTKDNTNTPRKSNTAKMKNCGNDFPVFDVDMFRDVKSHSAKQKTAELNPIGSCKLCHKMFLNLTVFKFHFKTKHKNYDPNDHKKLFQHILLKQGDDIDNNSAVKKNKSCSSKDLNHHLGKVDVDTAPSSSSDSNPKATICDDFLVPMLQNIPYPICKQSFDNHNLLANHHREKHAYADVEKLPPQDYMNDKFDKQEAIYCFKCKNILRTLMDVRKHSFTCTHQHFLPHSIVENAEWDPQNYMCKICDLKFANKHSLFRHMITKHCNDTNMLLTAAGHSTSLCSICNQQILVQKERAHFQQHREAFVKAMKDNSILDITAHSDGVCIFCGGVYSSVKLLCSHVNMHTYSDIFIKRNYVLKQKKSNQNLQLNDIKKQTLESSIHNSSDLGLVAVGSKIDDKKVSCEQPFKLSLETSHLQFPSKKCKAYTKPIKHRPDIDTGECSSSTPLTFTTKDNTNTPRKSNTAKMKNCGNDFPVFDVDMFRDVKSHSAKQKTAQLNPIGSCKLCHKKFLNLTAFKFHFKTKHKNYDPNDHKKLFQHILLKQGDDIDNNSAVKNKGCSSKDLNHHLGKVDDIAASSSSVSHKSLPRVCLMCRASFTKSSKYQAHLRTHITQCKVVLPDCFISQITSTDDCEPVGVDNVKIEVDNTTELDFTINDGSIFEQNTQTNQGETFHSVNTPEGGGFSQCKSINSDCASSSAQHTVDVELLAQNQKITQQENPKFEYIQYGFDFEHSTHNKVIKQENHNVDSVYRSESVPQVYDFGFSAQNKNVTRLENQNFISELQNATCETRIAKPGSCTSIMNGSLTNSITDIFRSASNASDQRECIIESASSLADVWTMLEKDSGTNNASTALKERQEMLSNENIVRYSRDITAYTPESTLTAETSAYQTSHNLTQERCKKRVYEKSCELNSEPKRSKLATSNILLLDCASTDDELSDISETDNMIWMPKLEPADNTQIALSDISETDDDVICI